MDKVRLDRIKRAVARSDLDRQAARLAELWCHEYPEDGDVVVSVTVSVSRADVRLLPAVGQAIRPEERVVPLARARELSAWWRPEWCHVVHL